MQDLTEILKAYVEAVEMIKEISNSGSENFATAMEKAYWEAVEKVVAFGAWEELADLATDPEEVELVKKPIHHRAPVLPLPPGPAGTPPPTAPIRHDKGDKGGATCPQNVNGMIAHMLMCRSIRWSSAKPTAGIARIAPISGI